MEHRHHIATDIGAKRILGGIARYQRAGLDLVLVSGQQSLTDHLSCHLLVDDDHVEVPFLSAGFFLSFELLEDLLRAGVARTCPHRDHLHAGVGLLEHGG
jgi:hypothetical protein